MLNITFQGNPLTVEGNQLKVGDKAPDFSVVKTDLSPIVFYDIKGVKIITTVPSLDTSVCSTQGHKFNAEADKLSGITILALSLDLPFAQGRWCGAEGITKMIVASDYQAREFATKYALLIKELKLLSRSVIVVDADNVIRYVEYVNEVTTEPNYTAALEAAKKLV